MAVNSSVDYLLEHDFNLLPPIAQSKIKEQGRETPQVEIAYEYKKGGKIGYRRFHSYLYEKVPWLTGCPKRNKLFCFTCLLFAQDKMKSAWTSTGFCSLTNFHKCANFHTSSQMHKRSEIMLSRSSQKKQLVGAQLEEHNKKVDHNFNILCRFVDCARFLAVHELPFRGENEESSSEFQGNFKDLIKLMAKNDYLLSEHLEHATIFRGDSSSVQNELIESLAICTRNKIQQEINAARFIAILVGEAPTTSNYQFSLSVRFFKDGCVYERFVDFLKVPDGVPVNAESLSQVLIERLKSMHCTNKVVAQSYESFSQPHKNIQQQVKKQIPTATSIHCHSHYLINILSKCVDKIPQARIFFGTLSGLHEFFLRSPQRIKLLNEVNLSLNQNAPVQPRWSFKKKGVQTLLSNYKAIVSFFQKGVDCEEGFADLPAFECAGFLAMMTKIDFRFLLCLFGKIFKAALYSIDAVKNIESCLPVVIDRVLTMDRSLTDLCSADSFNSLIQQADALADSSAPEGDTCKKNLEHFESLMEQVIHNVVDEISLRYGDLINLQFIGLMDVAMFPVYNDAFPDFLVDNLKLSPYAEFMDIRELTSELQLLYSDDSFRLNTPEEVLQRIYAENIDEPFCQTVMLINLILTLPIMTMPADHLFSSLGRIKTQCKHKMGDKRMSNLALIAIEKSVVNSVSNKDVITHFASHRNRRISLVYK